MSDFIMEINDLTHRSNEGHIYNISLGLKHREVHAVIIKNRGEQLAFIESIKSNKINNSSDLSDIKFKNIKFCADMRKIDIEVIYKDPILMENLSISENLFIDTLPRRKHLPFLIDWAEIKKKSEGIKTLFDFNVNFKHKVKELSTENKKMLYIYKYFNKNPKIIIMQEPMEYLSPGNVAKINKIIRNYVNNGGSIIYITKQWEEALSCSNWITVISKGEVNGRISTAEAKANPRKLLSFVEGYYYKDNSDKENNVINAVFKSAEYLTSEYELNEILMLLAKELTEVMGVEGCSINLINSPTNTIIDKYSYSRSLIELPPLREKVILEIASQKNMFYSNINDSEFKSLFDDSLDFKTIISIPILIRTQLSGVIYIYYKNIYIQSHEETMYLMTFAKHAAIAIEETRLMGRSALLQESHHRIKNNLQSVISLVTMQKEYLEGDNIKSINEIFDKIVYSIKSIASIHDLLSKNKYGGSIINLIEILDVLIATIGFVDITINKELENIFISHSKASSIAIIVNELLTNVKKHAFVGIPKDYNKVINLSLKMKNDDIILIVKDNGIGLPDDFDINNINSIGISIMYGIVKNEFKGDIYFIRDNGTTIKIVVSRKWII